MSIAIRLGLVAVALVLLVTNTQRAAVSATLFTVDSTTDAPDANPGDGVCASTLGDCTLRAAVMEMNALPGTDTLTVPAGTYTLTIEQEPGLGENTASSGDLNITDDLEIKGVGANESVIDGGKYGAIIEHVFTIERVSIIISDVTIQNGGWPLSPGGGIFNIRGTVTLNDTVLRDNVASTGGAILNAGALTVNGGAFLWNGPPGSQSIDGAISNGGTMTLDGVTFSHNYSGLGAGAIGNYHIATLNNITVEENATEGVGAGIYNARRMTLNNSTISGNSGGSGTGIFNEAGGELTVSNSTISNNMGGSGAGIFNEIGGKLMVNNTTVSGNTGRGAIANRGIATIAAATITGNANQRAGFAGGIHNDLGTANLTITNSIVAGNIGGDCGGSTPIVSASHNLSSDGTCPFTAAGDMTNTDPVLGPLGDNGGSTLTHALLAGSPAIDAGDNAACTSTDQRGFARPFDGNADGQPVCDVGAYESHRCPADVNEDGIVDSRDVRLVAKSISARPGSPRSNSAADLNGDGQVDQNDLHIVLRARKSHACR